MVGQMTNEVLSDTKGAYKVEVHNQIMHSITKSIHSLFLNDGTVYANLVLIYLRNFAEALSDARPNFAFRETLVSIKEQQL